MRVRDRERLRRLRFVVRRLLERGELKRGGQTRLAEHFGVSRQYVHQIVTEERRSLGLGAHAGDDLNGSTAL
jgi:hypothetical protein